jgi:hypothetical protein
MVLAPGMSGLRPHVWVKIIAVLLGGSVLMGAPPTTYAAAVKIQIVNADAKATVRVLLDGKVVYEDIPQPSSNKNNGPLPALAGTFELDGAKHTLIAEVPGTPVKAQLEWNQQHNPDGWLIVRYYPGRAVDTDPPFFTFSLRTGPTILK